MGAVRRISLVCWGLSLITLVAAAGGLSALTAGSTSTSLPRMAGAAAVLSLVSGFSGLLLAPRAQRSRGRCLLWGGAVSVLVGLGTALLVAGAAGPLAALWAALPWLAGPLLVWSAGPWLPAMRLPSLSSLRRTSRGRES